jgi:hypothetical protein
MPGLRRRGVCAQVVEFRDCRDHGAFLRSISIECSCRISCWPNLVQFGDQKFEPFLEPGMYLLKMSNADQIAALRIVQW